MRPLLLSTLLLIGASTTSVGCLDITPYPTVDAGAADGSSADGAVDGGPGDGAVDAAGARDASIGDADEAGG
jgi:hypothetical protein